MATQRAIDFDDIQASVAGSKPAYVTKPGRKPRARKTDPETSHQAARKVAGKADLRRVLLTAAVCDAPGRTAAEIARDLGHPEIDAYEASRRLPECEGLRKGASRQCEVKGTTCVTWEPI